MALQYSQQVADQQKSLNESNKATSGYVPLKVDGLLGPLTQNAITKYSSTTPTGLNTIATPSTAPAGNTPSIPNTNNQTPGVDTSKLSALGLTPEQISQVTSPQGMDPNSFNALLGNVKQKLTLNNELMDQRALIVKHLFDSPLTPEQQAKLPQDVRNVLAQGKDAAELQLRIINDQLQGRAQSLSSSIKDLTSGYTATIKDAEDRKQNAENNILKYLDMYGSNAVPLLKSKYPESAADIDRLAGIQTLAQQKQNQTNTSDDDITPYVLAYSMGQIPLTQIPQKLRGQVLSQVQSSGNNKMLTLLEQYRDKLDGLNIFSANTPSNRAYLEGLKGQITAEYKQQKQLGTLDAGVQKLIDSIVPNPSKLSVSSLSNKAQLAALDNFINNQTSSTMGNSLSQQVKSKGYDYQAMKSDGYTDEEIKKTLGIK